MASIGSDGGASATLHVGIIGLGGGASDMIPIFAQHPHIALTAAADIDPDQLETFRREFHAQTYPSAEALCADPGVDVVDEPVEFDEFGGTLGFEQDFNRLNFRVLGTADRRDYDEDNPATFEDARDRNL